MSRNGHDNRWRSPRALGLRYESWRPWQREALLEALSLPQRYIILEAPTGSGKSLIGVALGKAAETRQLYMVRTRHLQEQLKRDFPDAQVIMGRGNYSTANRPELTCEVCELKPGRRHCPYCCSPRHGCQGDSLWCDAPSRCAYTRARERALNAELVVTNIAYFLRDCQGEGGLATGRGWTVIDEADELPDALASHLAVEVRSTDLEELGSDRPPDSLEAEGWLPWAEALRDKVDERRRQTQQALEGLDELLARAEAMSWLRRLEELREGLSRFLESDAHSWAAVAADGASGPWRLVPLRPARYANSALWRHLEGRVLLMSATVLSPDLLAREMGLPEGSWAFLRLPSLIAPERRPVVYWPVVSVSRENMTTAWPRLIEALDRVLEAHRGERGVVHTHSYELARYVLAYSRHRERLVGHRGAQDRASALRRHHEKRDAVIVSPSLERGVDFRDDLARFSVLLKAPFPSLGDQWVRRRLEEPGGQEWYAAQTVRELVQACGRACRSELDYGVSYILDGQFGRLLSRWRRLFPRWFLDALVPVREGIDIGELARRLREQAEGER